MEFIKHFLVAAAIFTFIDIFWIGFAANKIYRSLIGNLIRKKFLVLPAIIFYVIYIVGLIIFALNPALHDKESLFSVASHGALLGFVCYATYDLTNLATLKGWSTKLTYIDLIWGTFLSGAVVSITFLIFR